MFQEEVLILYDFFHIRNIKKLMVSIILFTIMKLLQPVMFYHDYTVLIIKPAFVKIMFM